MGNSGDTGTRETAPGSSFLCVLVAISLTDWLEVDIISLLMMLIACAQVAVIFDAARGEISFEVYFDNARGDANLIQILFELFAMYSSIW